MKKTLKGLRNLEELFTEQGMTGLDYLSMSIGYDGKAYFLFSSKIPDRIDGMFVNTVANAFPFVGLKMYVFEEKRSRKERGIY